jgi:alpha-tubulin suppressor-like RCC1 family protein
MAQWKQYSGMWTRQSQMQAVSAQTWPNIWLSSTLWSMGANGSGQLGLGDRTDKSSPIQIGSLTNWSSVGCTNNSAAATRTDGTLWTWGNSSDGRLGLNLGSNYASRSSPVQVGDLTTWRSVFCVSAAVLAIKTDGTTWGFGLGTAIGLGPATSMSSPVQVFSGYSWSSLYPSPFDNSCFGAALNGATYAWGANGQGQLGIGSTTASTNPSQLQGSWRTISASGPFTLGIKTDGTLWSWGANAYGQLGQSNVINRSSPVQVGSLTTWTNVFTGLYSGFALDASGRLFAWGWNNQYQLGTGGTDSISSPVQIGSFDVDWLVGDGSSASMATKSGQLYGWGTQTSGQLGRGNTTTTTSVTSVGSGYSGLNGVAASTRIVGKKILTT